MFSLIIKHDTIAAYQSTFEPHSQSIRDQMRDLKKFDTKIIGEFMIKSLCTLR